MDDNPTWLVVFCDPEPLEPDATRRDRLLYWALHKFLKPGFRHVFAMRPAHGFDGWLIVNPHSACIDVLEVQGNEYLDQVVLPLAAEGRAHVVGVKANRPKTWVPRWLFSCVTTVAHVIGVECGILATPWRLYHILDRYLREDPTMGGFFSAPKPPPAPDTSAAEERAAKAEAERDRLSNENKAKVRNRRNRSRGRSLLAFNETGFQGVQPGAKDKLGQ